MSVSSERLVASIVSVEVRNKKFWTLHTDFMGMTDDQFEALFITVEREKERRGL